MATKTCPRCGGWLQRQQHTAYKFKCAMCAREFEKNPKFSEVRPEYAERNDKRN